MRKELEGFTPTDFTTRFHWKYSMEVYGIAGTPTFAANSIIIDGAETYGFNEWVNFLKKYTN